MICIIKAMIPEKIYNNIKINSAEAAISIPNLMYNEINKIHINEISNKTLILLNLRNSDT